jgi:Inositol hexakisphosphate
MCFVDLSWRWLSLFTRVKVFFFLRVLSHGTLFLRMYQWESCVLLVLNRLIGIKADGMPNKTTVIWTNLREEPLVYINDRPFVLRNAANPFTNLEYTGERVTVSETQCATTLRASIHKPTYTHTHTHTHTHIHTHAHAHAYTHSHIPTTHTF